MSLGLRTFAPVGCDTDGIVTKAPRPTIGCDTDGIVAKAPRPTIGCDTDGIAGKNLSFREKLALIGLSLGHAMNKASVNAMNNAPQMIVPPMTPGFPEGGVWG